VNIIPSAGQGETAKHMYETEGKKGKTKCGKNTED
jgi:hypothetical protein